MVLAEGVDGFVEEESYVAHRELGDLGYLLVAELGVEFQADDFALILR